MIKRRTTHTIILEDITFQYSKHRIIQDFSCTLQSWQKILLSGPSGSGKTTFLKLIWGILPPTSGTLSIKGLSWKEIQEERFSLFGYHLVDGDFFEEMSTRDNLLMLANIMDTPINENWYNELLTYFEMEKYESSKLHELSAWQRERVSLMRAFIHEPNILLLDEPGSHLDEILQNKLRDFITRYHDEHNATLIISSHGEFEDSFFDTFINFHEDYHISLR